MRWQKVKQEIDHTRISNPYPKDIFTEPTMEEKRRMREVLIKIGLKPDKFFGSFGRTVWNNCLDEIEKNLKPQGSGKSQEDTEKNRYRVTLTKQSNTKESDDSSSKKNCPKCLKYDVCLSPYKDSHPEVCLDFVTSPS